MTMRRVLVLSALLVLIASPAFALQANISWTNPVITPPQAAPTNILVQKAASLAGPFTTLHTLAPTATTDVDTAVTLGTPECIQLVWVYALGNATLAPQCATPAIGPAGTLLNIQFQ
jgi:hypothetical protein